MKRQISASKKGFTLIEILVAVSIISIFSAVLLFSFVEIKNQTILTRSIQEFDSIEKSLFMYQLEYGRLPPDANRDIPPGLERYLAPGIWPTAPWPGSVYDWDNWADPDYPGRRIYQISIRFCPEGQPSNCNFPDEPWAEDFNYHSAVYYCIDGNCRSHNSQPATHPGYCINCGN